MLGVALIDATAARLLVEGPFAAILPTVAYLSVVDRLAAAESPDLLVQRLIGGTPTGSPLDVAEYWAAAIVVLREVANETGYSGQLPALTAQLNAALSVHGLGGFADTLAQGVRRPETGELILSSSGAYRLTDGADTVHLASDLQAVLWAGRRR